jgi:uncharacterized integral membrane protein (TIGR00698 family)
MGLHEKLTILMSVGGAVCGASAVVAAETVVKAEKEDVVAPIGVITLFGTLGILIYPLLGRALHMPQFVYGVWTGASLHETAQVVAAGKALGADDVATVVKLIRIAMLAPICFYLAAYMRKHGDADAKSKVPLVPWFLVLFVVFALLNSSSTFGMQNPILSKDLVATINDVNVWVLCLGMAGVGLQTGFSDLKKAGVMALVVGFAQWLFLSIITFALATALCKAPPPKPDDQLQTAPITTIKRPM